MNREKSCGAVVFTLRNGQPLYAIVQEMAGAYSFPKGHVEGSETETETAAREVYEEIGLRPTFIEDFRETDEYDLREKTGTRKQVVYFLAEFHDEALVPRPGEIRDIRLLTYEEALSVFEYANTRRILTAAHDFITGR